MYKAKKNLAIIGLILISGIATSATQIANAQNANLGECTTLDESSEVQSCIYNGKEILVDQKGLGVEMPPLNSVSQISLDYTDGSEASLRVSRSASGDLLFESSTHPAKPISSNPKFLVSGLSSSNCGAGTSYAVDGLKPSQPYSWWYRKAYEPNTNVFNRIGESFNTWKSGINRCNTTIIPNSYQSSYAGLSTLQLPIQYDPTISSVPFCTTPGPKDLIGWGHMPIDILGATCLVQTGTGSTPARASIQFNSNTAVNWYAGYDPAGCSGSYFDLKGVATHEIGHSLGLDHVFDSGQVMRFNANYCDINLRGLGYGDVHGVADIYPSN